MKKKKKIFTALTPIVSFDVDKGILSLSGNSIADDVKSIYAELTKKVDEYSLKPQAKTTVTIDLQAITLNSSRSLLDLFKKLEVLHKNGKTDLSINWNYYNNDMRDEAETFQLLLQCPFNLVKK